VTINGRWARYYVAGERGLDRFYIAVTYHRRVRGQTRQLTVSPKLMRKMLRP
jgi:hypothetical protein